MCYGNASYHKEDKNQKARSQNVDEEVFQGQGPPPPQPKEEAKEETSADIEQARETAPTRDLR